MKHNLIKSLTYWFSLYNVFKGFSRWL